MSRRMRHLAASAALTAAITAASGASFSSSASAYVTSDLNDFNLTEAYTTFPTIYHVATGTDGAVSYRWLDAPVKSTVIGLLSCGDLANLGSPAGYAVGNTSYQQLWTGSAGRCFYVRGRTTPGSGSMSFFDGRVQR